MRSVRRIPRAVAVHCIGASPQSLSPRKMFAHPSLVAVVMMGVPFMPKSDCQSLCGTVIIHMGQTT